MTEATAEAKKTVKKAPKAPETASKARSKELAANSGLFAIIATGGKQYLVHEGSMLKIEKMLGEFKEGDKITFGNVLLTSTGGSEITLGNPFLKGVAVSATLKKISRYKTVDVIKYKQKSRYFKKNGHRQPYFEVQIDSIK